MHYNKTLMGILLRHSFFLKSVTDGYEGGRWSRIASGSGTTKMVRLLAAPAVPPQHLNLLDHKFLEYHLSLGER
jgi:hypothetical protein